MDMTGIEIGNVIQKAIKQQNVSVTKFRTTYIESKYGLAEMPRGLMLALILGDTKLFGWYLPKLSDEYILKFEE